VLFRVGVPLLCWSAVITFIVLNKLVRLLVFRKYEITEIYTTPNNNEPWTVASSFARYGPVRFSLAHVEGQIA